jgi:hypothetical protein
MLKVIWQNQRWVSHAITADSHAMTPYCRKMEEIFVALDAKQCMRFCCKMIYVIITPTQSIRV